MKKYLAAIIVLGIVGAGVFIRHAIAAPARDAARNLAAINGLTVGQTTEAELLARKEFQTMERTCFQAECFYHVETSNTFLSGLHLAPPMRMSTAVAVRNGLVTGVLVFTLRDGLTAISLRQVSELPPGCNSSPCVKRMVPPNKILVGIAILFSSDSNIRNQIPEAVNGECFSRLHGCNTYAELLPITKNLDLEAADQPASGK